MSNGEDQNQKSISNTNVLHHFSKQLIPCQSLPEQVTAFVLQVGLWEYEGTTDAAAGWTVEVTGQMEKVDEAGLGAAGFITVTCRVCWLWVYDVTPWLYPGLGARKDKSGGTHQVNP